MSCSSPIPVDAHSFDYAGTVTVVREADRSVTDCRFIMQVHPSLGETDIGVTGLDRAGEASEAQLVMPG
jgi:hypothetical protein